MLRLFAVFELVFVSDDEGANEAIVDSTAAAAAALIGSILIFRFVRDRRIMFLSGER